MPTSLRIGTRESQLAVWQATRVQELLQAAGVGSELVYIKSEGDVDTVTPLYALGVQGVFTKTLDAALLGGRIDIAVHSMKDVPTQLAEGIQPAAVLQRASYKDILVYKGDPSFLNDRESTATIGTSSIRRIAQWLHRYPNHRMENLRGNVNTRLRKVEENPWNGAIFAAAGLERIHLRPESSVDLDWMLPAPAQGAIIVVCRTGDETALEACRSFHDAETALCTQVERDFLRTLMGGCSTPISGLAEIRDGRLRFRGNLCTPDGRQSLSIEKEIALSEAPGLGITAAQELLGQGAGPIVAAIRKKVDA
ncbi:MAG TPA: hydroxymethylbilane synthase [Chitinophagaceae bacterium]|jgi:hydroxymethylbilane synthase|nr:hydroxymethylbilane synthase [Chitinophagaceae bacterium]